MSCVIVMKESLALNEDDGTTFEPDSVRRLCGFWVFARNKDGVRAKTPSSAKVAKKKYCRTRLSSVTKPGHLARGSNLASSKSTLSLISVNLVVDAKGARDQVTVNGSLIPLTAR
jgi:hypothetical protein